VCLREYTPTEVPSHPGWTLYDIQISTDKRNKKLLMRDWTQTEEYVLDYINLAVNDIKSRAN